MSRERRWAWSWPSARGGGTTVFCLFVLGSLVSKDGVEVLIVLLIAY